MAVHDRPAAPPAPPTASGPPVSAVRRREPAAAGAVAAGAAVVRRALRDVERLLLPVACPGCRTPDVRWCARCLDVLHAPPRRCEAGAPRLDRLDGVAPLPVWTLADYTGGLRDVVVAWKDRGRADLDAPLAAAARRAGVRLGPELARSAGTCGVLVVPAPSSRAARRTRGRDPVATLARAFAAGVPAGATPSSRAARRTRGRDPVATLARAFAAGVPAGATPLLAQRGRSRDQVGLGSRARGARLGAVDVAPAPGRAGSSPPGRPSCSSTTCSRPGRPSPRARRRSRAPGRRCSARSCSPRRRLRPVRRRDDAAVMRRGGTVVEAPDVHLVLNLPAPGGGVSLRSSRRGRRGLQDTCARRRASVPSRGAPCVAGRW
ncbi:hypothetical protein BJF88_06110 [Cellulosimicrobium sp. CUA-896]|nr:hypothetical protein BJF88_06110 [Cellulosimicrobium sp. CUA-896]